MIFRFCYDTAANRERRDTLMIIRAASYLRFRGAWCARSQTKKESQKMKKLLLSIAVAAAAPFAWAQVSETTTTTTTTESGGTITEFVPNKTIVLKETSGTARTYRLGSKVIYVTKSLKPIDETSIKVG